MEGRTKRWAGGREGGLVGEWTDRWMDNWAGEREGGQVSRRAGRQVGG